MNDEAINQVINKYVKEHLSPKEKQREYISEKYVELWGFLKGSCFQTGSYARYTAIDPVHDLDVIHPVADVSLQDNPSLVIDALYAILEEEYSASATRIKKIYRQSHSVTVEFDNATEEFSIDVVPSIELPNEQNEYKQPFYLVPEILPLNKHNRQLRYEKSVEEPIGWIKSDPRGYIKAASDLNEKNSDFRHSAKLVKSWRHACKMNYGDDFCLKSFHLEQIVFNIFSDNEGILALDAITEALAAIPGNISEPQIQDRADSERYIDDYVEGFTQEQKKLILNLQAEAYAVVRKLSGCQTEQEVMENLDRFLAVRKKTTNSSVLPIAAPTIPRQPWSY